MPRTYAVSFEQVACSQAQDLVQITGAAGKILRILSVAATMADQSPPTNQQIALRGRFLPATVTNGSGGSSPTPQPYDPGDAAASFTAKANSTTKATTNGTASVLLEDACNAFGGYLYMFPRPPVVGPSEAFVFELLNAPNGTMHISGTVVVEETGG
jgi:hypothetical protein